MIEITIITGLYGSGKSEFSLQYALHLSNKGQKVFIGDLDVVNVYFRSREQTEFLKNNNIEVLGNILGEKANTDVPNFAPNFYNALNTENAHLILDLAGSEVGLRMIPSFIEKLVEKNQGKYEFLYMFNMYRDGNQNIDEFKKQIEVFNTHSNLNITGIINNSHLMEYTTCEDIISGQEIILNAKLDLKIKFTHVSAKLNCSNIEGEVIYMNKQLLKAY